MKIGLNTPANLAAEMLRLGRHERSSEGVRAKDDQLRSDEARISLDQARVRSLEAEIGRLPEVRKEKVEALRQAMAQGAYRVDAEQIAEAMSADFGWQRS
ncbi:MAG TPA: flagellar biosynthesis anti-sigma factor FlgM [Terriglobales bacterium]|nr:flagellar biosynthesis anti-sigma factor FlgM [Terriglobales bacterium]